MRRIKQAVHSEALDPMPGIGKGKKQISRGCLHGFHPKLQSYWRTASAASSLAAGPDAQLLARWLRCVIASERNVRLGGIGFRAVGWHLEARFGPG